MASKIPRSMRALAVSKYCLPAEYGIATLPVPEISKPDELLVRVHAASVNPVDVKMVGPYVSSPIVEGFANIAQYGKDGGRRKVSLTFPYPISYDRLTV
jgi:NADPH:quinone reductase-like Zn-dependent oxidoreductase